MGDYLRLLTINDRDIPLATLQRAVPNVAIWSVDHPGILGNYLAIGGELGVLAKRLGDDRAQPGRPRIPWVPKRSPSLSTASTPAAPRRPFAG